MAELKKFRIGCPHCGEEQDVEVCEVVNVHEEPHLRELLLNGKFNTTTCEKCDLSFRLDSVMLYHDSERGIIVHCIPAPDSTHAALQKDFCSSMQSAEEMLPDDVEPPPVHLVFSRAELIERICLLEMGLDERVLEYIKYLIHIRNSERLDPLKIRLLLNPKDSTEDKLYFVTQDLETGKLVEMLEYDRNTYDALEQMFDDDNTTPNLLELFPGPYISAREVFINEREQGQTAE